MTWYTTDGGRENGIIDVTNVLVHDSYFLRRIKAGHCYVVRDGKFFNFQASKLGKPPLSSKRGCVQLSQ